MKTHALASTTLTCSPSVSRHFTPYWVSLCTSCRQLIQLLSLYSFTQFRPVREFLVEIHTAKTGLLRCCLHTFFTRAATELFGSSNDESLCVFSSKRIDHSSRIRMAKFNVQTRHCGSGCFSFFLRSQIQGLLFFFAKSTTTIFLNNWVIIC